MKAKLYKVENTFYLKVGETILGTSSNPNLSASIRYSLSLKNCQAIENSYDLDELVEEAIIQFVDKNEQVGLFDIGFLKGFQKALSILDDKKFTYNQMVSAIIESSISHRLPSLIIQDLQQTEWDVVVKMKPASLVYLSNLVIEELDEDDCLILKRIKE